MTAEAPSFRNSRLPAQPWALLLLAALACAAFFTHPLALLLFVCLAAIVVAGEDLRWVFLFSACTLFTALNVSRLVDGDLVSYVALQEYTSHQPFQMLFDKESLRAISGTYRTTEIGFYAPLWLLSFLIPDSKTAIAVAATAGIYIPTFLGLNMIGKQERWGNGLILTVAAFTFFAAINFVQSSHLIRQYISCGFLFYGFALFLGGRRKWALVCALYACTVHNGTASLLPVLMTSILLFPYARSRPLRFGGLLVRLIVLVIVLAGMMAVVPILQGEVLKEEIPNIHVGHYIAVGALFLVAQAIIVLQRVSMPSVYYARSMYLAVYVFSLGFYVLELRLFALRYFAYLEWIYGLLVAAILVKLLRNQPGLRVFARLMVAIAAATILVARIAAAEWHYGAGDNNLLAWDFFEVTGLMVR